MTKGTVSKGKANKEKVRSFLCWALVVLFIWASMDDIYPKKKIRVTQVRFFFSSQDPNFFILLFLLSFSPLFSSPLLTCYLLPSLLLWFQDLVHWHCSPSLSILYGSSYFRAITQRASRSTSNREHVHFYLAPTITLACSHNSSSTIVITKDQQPSNLA